MLHDQFAGMDRRGLLQRAALLVGASMAVGGCNMLAGPGNDADFALSTEQMALLSAVSATMVPKTDTAGAIEVGVPESFEGLLRDWASAETLDKILGAMERIDTAAIDTAGSGFLALDEAKRFEVLSAHDAHALELDPDAEPVPGANPFALAGPAQNDPGYALMRELVLTLYYMSEPGQTEELRYEHNPGLWEPSTPVTADTRPWGGADQF